MISAFRYFSILFILLVTACATMAPIQEMSDARQAIKAAKEVGVDVDSSVELQSAEWFVEQAARQLENGEYEAARKTALEARRRAVRAAQDETGTGTR